MGLIKFKHAFRNEPTFFDDFFAKETFRNPEFNFNKSVPVNIKETDKLFEIEVLAPGLKKENFNLEINQDDLAISYKQQTEKEERDETTKFIRKEFTSYSFERHFTINEKLVDVESLEAKYENGILYISLPKFQREEKKEVKKVEVK
jgi:HSP20 family protein